LTLPSYLKSLIDFLFDMLYDSARDEDQETRSLWIGCDLMQTISYRFWGTDVLYKGTLDHINKLFDKHVKLPLSGNLRNTHGIAMLLADLIEKFLEKSGEYREILQKILPQQGFHHFIKGFTPKLYCVLGKETSRDEDRMTRIMRTELKLIHQSIRAAQLDYKIAVIPVYHYASDITDVMSGRGSWCTNFQSLVKQVTYSEGLTDFQMESNFTDYVKYSNSMEFPCAVLVIDLTAPELEDSAVLSGTYELSLMNILAHLYVGVSRARVYCSIILICSDDEPNELFKGVRDILLPHVKTIELH